MEQLPQQPSPFDRIRDRILERRPFLERFRNRWLIRWMFCKLELAGASPFLDHDAQGNEYLRCARPWVGKLLFRRVAVISHHAVLA